MTSSFLAGMSAAKNGTNINNSYPYDHEEFVSGHKSVSGQKENINLKLIAMNMAPEEYPHKEVEGELTKEDIYLFRKTNTFCSANVSDKDLDILNTLLEHGYVVKVKLVTPENKYLIR